MTFLLAATLAASLNATEIAELDRFSGGWSEPSAEARVEARRIFAGRGVAIAEHFLLHNDPVPRNDAYFFVLQALGEPDAALHLLRALPEPPRVESGPLDRHFTEIDALLGAMLENESVGSDPRVIAAVVEAVAAGRAKPYGVNVAEAAVELLGKCRGPQAVAALDGFAADPDAAIRTAAARALGWLRHEGLVERPAETVAEPRRVIDALGRTLLHDGDTTARREAAESLGRLGLTEGIEPLRAALDREESPEAVDAVVYSLERLGAPLADPARSRDVAARCWEADAARPLFERWRATVSREMILRAAIEDPPTLRSLALDALVREAKPPAVPAPLLEPIPPPPAPPGAAPVRVMIAPVGSLSAPEPRRSRPADLDPVTTEALIASSVDLLGRELSRSTTDLAMNALWALVDEKAAEALRRTDEISDRAQRFWASHGIHYRDPTGYDRYRRTRELLVAATMALPFVVLFFFAPARPFAVIGLAAVTIWGVTTFLDGSALTLPPWPYPISKVRFLATAAAAVAAGAALWLPRRRWLAAVLLAGILFWIAYQQTRSIGFYPPDTQSGYLFIFEPIGGLLVAPALAAMLAALGARWRKVQ